MSKFIAFILLLSVLICSLAGCNGDPKNGSLTTEENTQSEANGSENSFTTATAPAETKGEDTPSVPGAAELVSHWTFDEIGTNGALADENGKLTAAAENCGVIENTVFDSGLSFMPARCSGVNFGTGITDVLKENGAITLSFWFYKSARDLKPQMFNLYMEDGKYGVQIRMEDNTVYVSARSDVTDVIHTKTYKCGSVWDWNHLAVSIDISGGSIRFYWNGNEQKPSLGTSGVTFHRRTYNPGTPVYEDRLGGSIADHYEEASFSGYIDDVYLWSGALSSGEIKTHYQRGAAVVTAKDMEKSMYNTLKTLTSSNTVVLSVNSPVVLSNVKRCYLVPGNASAKVVKRGGTLYVPTVFFKTYFGNVPDSVASLSEFSENGVEYIPLVQAAQLLNIELNIQENGLIFVGEYCNAFNEKVIAFLYEYYNGDAYELPETEDDFANSRSVVMYSNCNSNGISLGSPSIAMLPDGTLIASFDYNGKYTAVSGGKNDTGICRSADGGKTWIRIAVVPRLMWATLFELNGDLYLIGRDTQTTKLAIVKSGDAGQTWTSPDSGQIDSEVTSLHHAPTPAVICNGRIYIAFEDSCNAQGVAKWTYTKRAYMMSAPVDSDLLSASSWTKSNYVDFDPSWMDPERYYGAQMGFLEGNAVAGKDGNLYIFLRVESDPVYGFSCVLKLSENGRNLTFDRIIDLPVGKDKFVIRYDEISDCYIAIGNIKTQDHCATQRNVVAMYLSADLEHWTYAATLLTDCSLMPLEQSIRNHGMQYPDFMICGDDLYMVLREAVDETTYYHNANYIAFYAIRNFRRFLPEGSTERR